MACYWVTSHFEKKTAHSPNNIITAAAKIVSILLFI